MNAQPGRAAPALPVRVQGLLAIAWLFLAIADAIAVARALARGGLDAVYGAWVQGAFAVAFLLGGLYYGRDAWRRRARNTRRG